MNAWFRWLGQWIQYMYIKYKPKPRVRPGRLLNFPKPKSPPSPPKINTRVERKYAIPQKHTLEVLHLLDNFRNAKGSAHVEKHLLWKKIHEILPLSVGTWEIDTSDTTQIVIKEVIR